MIDAETAENVEVLEIALSAFSAVSAFMSVQNSPPDKEHLRVERLGVATAV